MEGGGWDTFLTDIVVNVGWSAGSSRQGNGEGQGVWELRAGVGDVGVQESGPGLGMWGSLGQKAVGMRMQESVLG